MVLTFDGIIFPTCHSSDINVKSDQSSTTKFSSDTVINLYILGPEVREVGLVVSISIVYNFKLGIRIQNEKDLRVSFVLRTTYLNQQSS